MGQRIQTTTTIIGDVLLLDGDRAVTGQDGTVYPSAEAAAADERFPGRLAAELFGADPGVDHVFIASSQIVIRRPAGWDEEAVGAVQRVVEGFFIFYE